MTGRLRQSAVCLTNWRTDGGISNSVVRWLRGPRPKWTPPISKLPVELVLIVFSFCEPGVKPAIILSHTCRYWRSIALSTGELWTSVEIRAQPRCDEAVFYKFYSLLDMQFDRAGELLLDVFWCITGSDTRKHQILHLIRRKGPFCRWRTLTIDSLYLPYEVQTMLLPEDAFTNLVSLTVIPYHRSAIIEGINRTITTKFHTLGFGGSQHVWGTIASDYDNLLKNAKRLILSKEDSFRSDGPSLPPNIVELEAGVRTSHVFPHIKQYTLFRCILLRSRGIDLRQMTTLTVEAQLVIESGAHVSLPSLLHLTFGVIHILSGAFFEAKNLQTLNIGEKNNSKKYEGPVEHLKKSINSAGYRLSPQTLVRVGYCLPADVAVQLLEQSPHVQAAFLAFDNPKYISQVLDFIVRGDGQSYPHLEELTVSCLWEGCDLEYWSRKAEGIAEQRRIAGRPLRIDIISGRATDATEIKIS